MLNDYMRMAIINHKHKIDNAKDGILKVLRK